MKINYHNGFTSKVECALSRGDEKYNDFILALHKKGVYLSTWDENVDKTMWEQTANECGFDIDKEAQKSFSLDDELPWDIIDTGIDKKWLIEQYKKAMENKNTIPCEFNCVDCGVCRNLKTHKILDKPYIHSGLLKKDEIAPEQEHKAKKYRLKLTKENEMKYISHLDWQNTVTKMLYRSGLDLCFSQGFNPTPKFSLGIALPLFVESKCELIDVEIYNDIEEKELVKKLNSVLNDNIRILRAEKIDKKTEAIDILAQWALYSFKPFEGGILQKEDLLYIKEEIFSLDEIMIEKINKKGIRKLINIKPSIKSVEAGENELLMVLKTGQSSEIPSIKPDEVIKKFKPDVYFKITREAFYDKDMNKL